MSANGDACTAPPDHRMAHVPHHFEVWAKILEHVFDVSPQLEKSVRMPCKYTILEESSKKKNCTASCRRTSQATRRKPHQDTRGWWAHNGVSAIVHFNCLNTNTTTLNTVVHHCMSLTNVCLRRMYTNDNVERTFVAFRRLAITRQHCGTCAAPAIV